MRKPVPPPASTLGWLLPAALVFAVLFLLGLFSTETADSDFWWHLATGGYIVQQHRLPVPDPFAYTTANAAPAYPGEAAARQFNLTHEWLAQAFWYALYAAGGFPLLVLWKAVLLTLFCGLVGLTAARRTRSGWWGIAAALAAAALATEFAHDRPALLTYVFTAAYIAILDSRRRLYLLPVLALVWANCHGGFFLGWIVCGAIASTRLFAAHPIAAPSSCSRPPIPALRPQPQRLRISRDRPPLSAEPAPVRADRMVPRPTSGVRPTPSISSFTPPLSRSPSRGFASASRTGCCLSPSPPPPSSPSGTSS